MAEVVTATTGTANAKAVDVAKVEAVDAAEVEAAKAAEVEGCIRGGSMHRKHQNASEEHGGRQS
jgi:hypothetical protein